MFRKSIVIAFILLLFSIALHSAEKGCAELIQLSEALWVKLDYEGSDQALKQAQALCPETAELYWRQARNEYDRMEMIPRDKKPPAEELLARYNHILALAERCIELDREDGNCWLWKAVGLGRRGSTQGVLKTVFEVDDLEAALLKALELKPGYRSVNGAASSLADINSMLGILYRVLPEWTCSFPFQSIIGTCGDLDKSLVYHRRAVEMEPARIEFHKELAITLMCRGQRRNKPEDLAEAKRILEALQSMPEFKATDPLDKQHAQMLLQDPALACGYSRDAQQEQSPEAFSEGTKKQEP